MGGSTVIDNTYSISVKRGSKSLVSGANVSIFETLIVNVVPDISSSVQYLIESTAGTFQQPYSSCQYSRTINEDGVPMSHALTMPATVGTANIYVAWQTLDAPVSLSPAFVLHIQNSTNRTAFAPPPIVTPASNNIQPRIFQSVGIAFGLSFFMLVIHNLVSSELAKGQNVRDFTLSTCLSLLSCFMGIISFALVVFWATGDTASDTAYLGVPDMSSNPFPYHPVFMVVLVFNAFILRVVTERFLERRIGTLYDIYSDLIHILIVIGIIVAIYSASLSKDLSTSSNSEVHKPALVSMHAWIGVFACLMALTTVVWYVLMRVCRHAAPTLYETLLERWGSLISFFPQSAFFLSSLAIATGISDQLNQSACLPRSSEVDVDYTLLNVYPGIPVSCRVANGLGISVMLATLSIWLLLRYRGIADGRKPMVAELAPLNDAQRGARTHSYIAEQAYLQQASRPLSFRWFNAEGDNKLQKSRQMRASQAGSGVV